MQRSFSDKVQYELLKLDPSIVIQNPFDLRSRQDMEQPHLHLLRMMRDPDYFYFTCKSLMNGPSGRPLELLPFQCVILKELWYRPFPMLIATRGGSKSFLLGLYALLRALFIQGRKIVITGSGFRQAKTVFNYAETIWYNSPILQSLVAENSQSGPHHDTDRWWLRVGDSTITALPLGSGEKIRGERAHDILCDEFACLDASTLVETEDGLQRIGDTVARRGLRVFTGADGETEEVARYIRTPPTEAYRVRTAGGCEFICSGIHRVGTDLGWKLGKDLARGDLIECPPPCPFPERYLNGVDENAGWLLGILTAEGSVNAESNVSVQMIDHDCIQRVRSAMQAFDPSLNPGIYHREPYYDDRGWMAKESWVCCVGTRGFRDALADVGLDRTTAHGKKIPWSVLQSPRSVVVSFLSALFEGDGSAFLWTDRRVTNKFGVAFYSVSEQLCREVQVVLRKLGFFSAIQRRRSKLSDNWQWMLRLNGGHALRLAELLDIPKWRTMLDAADRVHTRDADDGVVWDKSRGRWQARAHVGGRRRFLGRYATEADARVAVAEATSGRPTFARVVSVKRLPGKRVLYDYYLPRNHSFIGNGFRQHNSVPWEIFETVVSGFGVVELDPVDSARRSAEIRVLKRENLWTSEMSDAERKRKIGNQTVISGTAFYQFNHFADYWKRWKGIVESRGDPRVLEQLFPNGIDDKFDWRDYSVIRLPVTLLPEGFMAEKQVARSRATQHSSIFLNEFSACFASDSNGFYKRSLVESCVTKEPILVDGVPVQFRAATRGYPDGHYVFGIDPASEHDRFSIVVLEVYPSHRRVVYCWTTTRKDHAARIKAGLKTDADFYGFCCRKIRDLMKLFPCEHIAMDSQGGGIAVAEALHDPDKMESGEQPLWLITADHPLSDKKERDCDDFPGLHILEMVNFARSEWVAEANHGMRKDFEDRVLLFPEYDTGLLAIAMEEDQRTGRIFDTLESAVEEVEEIKEELATIVHTQIPGSFRDKWDTPEVKLAGSRKGRLRKDRYSALLLANSAARRLNRQVEQYQPPPIGGFVGHLHVAPVNPRDKLYVSAPEWFTKGLEGDTAGYGWVVKRSGVE